MPLRHSSSPLVWFEETCGACGPASHGIAPLPHPDQVPRRENEPRWAEREPPPRYLCTPCRAAWLAAGSKNPVLPWSAETRLPRALEKERASTRIEVHSTVQGLATPVGIAPIRLLQVVPRPFRCREEAGRREPTPSATGLSLSPSRVEERSGPVTRRAADVRLLASYQRP